MLKEFSPKPKESGRYRNVSKAVRAGLLLLEQEKSENRANIEWLRQELAAGEESGESDSTLNENFAEVKTEFDAK